MNTEYIATEIQENIGIITLNNPKTLNSINEKMIMELAFKIDEFNKINNVSTVEATDRCSEVGGRHM